VLISEHTVALLKDGYPLDPIGEVPIRGKHEPVQIFKLASNEIALFNDSLERCTARHDFLDRFYQRFSASSQEVAEKFRNTDFNTQKKLLKTSLYMIMLAAMGKPEAQEHLERIAQVHSRNGRGIRPELYDLWLNSLIGTVRDFDPGLNADTECAWRSMMASGIAFMKSRY
jgi:hemoglobin-like flavoprotein